MGEIGEDGGRVYKLLVINYKFWGSNAQHGSKYWVVYLKFAKIINIKSSHHSKKKKSNHNNGN